MEIGELDVHIAAALASCYYFFVYCPGGYGYAAPFYISCVTMPKHSERDFVDGAISSDACATTILDRRTETTRITFFFFTLVCFLSGHRSSWVTV